MKRYYWIIGIGIGLVVLIAAMSYVLYFARTVNPPHTAAGVAADCGTPVPSTGLRSFQIVPAQTTASYKVRENLVLRNLPNNDAVGKTNSVEGTFQVRTGNAPLVAGMNISIDLSTLKTDEERRDNYVRQNYLETDTYPKATFVSTCVQGLPASYSDGQTVQFQITGNLTLHGKTNKAVFDVQGKVEGQTVTGTATSTVFMTDYGIDPPNLANIAISENKVLLTLDFTAKEG